MAINMRRLRHDQDLTQEELAARAELSMRYVGSIERARVAASVSVLGRLAKALDVDPCELIRQPGKQVLCPDRQSDADGGTYN